MYVAYKSLIGWSRWRTMGRSGSRTQDNREAGLPARASYRMKALTLPACFGFPPIRLGRSPSPRLEGERPATSPRAGMTWHRLTKQCHESCISGPILKVTPLKSPLLCGIITHVRCTTTRTLTPPGSTSSGASSVCNCDWFLSNISMTGWFCGGAEDSSPAYWLQPSLCLLNRNLVLGRIRDCRCPDGTAR